VNKPVWRDQDWIRAGHRSVAGKREQGFSVLELLIVVTIILIVLGYAIPIWITSLRSARIRGTESAYASILQIARTRAVNDDRYYSVYIQAAAGDSPQMAYVDIYPQNVNGTSGRGAPPIGSYNPGPPADPMVMLSPEAVPQTQGSAPNTGNLLTQFCGSCAAAIVLNTPPTWGPDGLPCALTTSAGGTGLVCNSAGGPVAYVAYFQSSTNQEWDAVTISPAGRIKTWYYGAGGWIPFNQ
jgi:prepilin-type N-terminal cleavage/methylation domain-containing protein